MKGCKGNETARERLARQWDAMAESIEGMALQRGGIKAPKPALPPHPLPANGWGNEHFAVKVGRTTLPGMGNVEVSKAEGVGRWAECDRCDDGHIFERDKYGYEYAKPCTCSQQTHRVLLFNDAALPPQVAREDWTLLGPGLDRSDLNRKSDPSNPEAGSAAMYFDGGRWLSTSPYSLLTRFTKQGRPDGRWLILSGPNGTGKTRLAASVARHLIIRRGLRCMWMSWPDFIKAAKDAIGNKDRKGGVAELVEKMSTTDFLFMDDLGQERTSEYTQSLTREILEARHAAQRATIITTNRDPSDRGGGTMAPLSEHLGHATISRVRQYADYVFLRGQDRRANLPSFMMGGSR